MARPTPETEDAWAKALSKELDWPKTPLGEAAMRNHARREAEKLSGPLPEIKGVKLRDSRAQVVNGIVVKSKIGTSGVAADEYVAMHSKNRLVQTSAPYPSEVEALEAAHAILQTEFCDYSYVTEDNRTVGIFDYYDVTPDQKVQPGQRRVKIPSFNRPDKQED